MALCSRGGEGRDGALQSWSAYGSVSAKSTSTRGIEAAEAAWLERAMKLARKARTSDSETVATTTSTSSRPSNCDPCATHSPFTHAIAQPSKYSRPPSQPFWLA